MNMLFSLVIALCMFSTRAEGKKLTGSEKSKCVNQLLEWCKGTQSSKGGLQISRSTYQDNGSSFQVTCVTDSKGTNCNRDQKPWFTCSPDHVLTYKGKEMSEGMTNVDNGICEARKTVKENFATDDEDTDTDDDDMDWDDLLALLEDS